MPYPKEKVGGKNAILERQQIFVEHLTHDDAGAAFLFACFLVVLLKLSFFKNNQQKRYTHTIRKLKTETMLLKSE